MSLPMPSSRMAAWLAQWLRVAAMLALTSACAACLRVDQTLAFMPDGSGTFEIVYSAQNSTIRQIATIRQYAAGLDPAGPTNGTPADVPLGMFLFDEAAIRAAFAPFAGKGLSLDSVKIGDSQGWRQVELKLTFDSLATLAASPLFRDFEIELSRDSAGRLVFVQRLPPDPLPPLAPGDPRIEQDVVPALGGLRATVRVIGPGRLLASNASQSLDQTAIWEFDLARNTAPSLAAMQNLNLRAVFDGTGSTVASFRKPAGP